jgi:hypothetical protein
MFKQSLIQVFKGLAEFHGYVPSDPTLHTEANQSATITQPKPIVVAVPKQPATVSCC